MLVVAWAAVIAAPPLVQVIASPEPGVYEAARQLRSDLAGHGRVRVVDEVMIAGEADPAARTGAILDEVEGLVQEAHGLFTGLNGGDALAKVNEVRAKLGLLLDQREAATLLAEALRIKGLVYLFMEKPEQAGTAFFSASLLDPDYVPDSQKWPPEARLAYADAIANARRDAGGILSVDVSPPAAGLWLDGRSAGFGPTTVSSLAPGEHFVLATCPGYNRVAAVVTVTGGGQLNQAALYLEALPEEIAEPAQVAALGAAFGKPDEARVAKLLAEQLGVEALVYLTTRAGAEAAWVIDASGEHQGEAVVVVPGHDAATEIEVALLGEAAVPVSTPIPPPPPPVPQWYERWDVWLVVSAAVVVVGGTAVYVGASQGRNLNSSVYLGGGTGP